MEYKYFYLFIYAAVQYPHECFFKKRIFFAFGAELTFAKTSGTVIRGGKNWPIADRFLDWRIPSNDPKSLCEI